MSAVALLDAYIKDLNDCISNGNVQSIYDPNALATDIATRVISEISTDDYGHKVCAILFTELYGHFYRKSTVYSTAVYLHYKEHLLTNCCSFILRGKHARAKCAALEVMFAIFDTDKSKLDTVVLNVEDLFNKYIEMAVLPVTALPQTVKGRVLELLGIIAMHYPEIAAPQINAIKRWCLTSLNDHLIDQKSTSLELAASALKTFKLILNSPKLRIDPDSEEGEKLYSAVVTSLKLPEGVSRYALQMAALSIIQNNVQLFSDHLLSDYKTLYTRIQIFCEHQNRMLSRLGYGALESLLKQIAVVLSQSNNNDSNKNVFLVCNIKYFVEHFHKLLDEKDVVESFRKNSVAIRGIGYFLKVSKNFLDNAQINTLMQLLVKKSDWFYSESNSETYRVLGHLPSFIQAYTHFAKEFDTIPLEMFISIQKISEVFIVSFARMPIYNRRPGIIAMKELFQMLYVKGEGVLRNFLDTFFNKAMVCTCIDIELPGQEKQHSYVDLLYFWKSILTDTIENPDIDIEYDESDEDVIMIDFNTNINENETKLKDVMCDCFMDTVLHIIKMLNLDLKKVGQEENEAVEDEVLYVMSGSLQPVNPKDFILFQNLVEFWCLLLKDMENTRLTEWFYITGSSLVNQSLQKPLVSGFYRMIAQLMVIIERQRYFRGFKDILHASHPTQDQIEKSKSNAYNTYLVLHGYMKDILHKSQQFKDELLASCLHLILSYPIEFFDLTELVVPLKTALHFGISYSPLAVAALATLEKLEDPEYKLDTNANFLSSVLPSINEYLIVKVNVNQETRGDINEPKKRFKIRSASQRQYTVNRSDMSSDEVGVTDNAYTSLEELQLQMMRYLGRLGAKSKQLLQSGEVRDDLISWDPKKHLKIDIPFPNAKAEVSMGEMLPRVCTLAESSPDRHIKIAACELLHSLVLVMIGNSAFQAKDTRNARNSRYHDLYLRVFPVMLKLAIDVDQVARDMFRLLNAQIIHWLTNNAQYENPETIALLEVCLEAACDTNAGLRDYGADCVQEFTKWSIKQSSSKLKNNPMNMKSLLKRLYNFMANPNSSKRFGASLVFNRIYRLFREEESLIEEYTLEILGQLFFSLKLSES
ncbi:hypothetical protein K501DRAFT_306200, partial [Backusella circina FSU 941]